MSEIPEGLHVATTEVSAGIGDWSPDNRIRLPRFERPDSFDGGVMFCPVCCTHVDAEPDVTGWVLVECTNCATRTLVEVDPDKFAEFAGVG